LYEVTGTPLAEVSLLPSLFSSAMAFAPGPFERFAGPGGGRLALAAEAQWGNEDLFVTILTPASPGDYNGDGSVNGSDYSVWRGAFGSASAAADGNTDGTVDVADYLLWRANASASPTTATNATVPEVTSVFPCLVLLACHSWLRRSRA
jgi:hypothetical protein